MRSLLRSKHFLLTVDDEVRLVTRARTVVRFESLAELESAYEALVQALEPIDRSHYGQLIDARRSPARNDPEFEATVARYHDALYRGFRANAVLVQSAVGRLQVRRMLDASGVGAPVFSDEAEALEYLHRAGDPPATRTSRPPRSPA